MTILCSVFSQRPFQWCLRRTIATTYMARSGLGASRRVQFPPVNESRIRRGRSLRTSKRGLRNGSFSIFLFVPYRESSYNSTQATPRKLTPWCTWCVVFGPQKAAPPQQARQCRTLILKPANPLAAALPASRSGFCSSSFPPSRWDLQFRR